MPKYELIYLKAFENGIHLYEEVKQWFSWYDKERYHQALEYKTVTTQVIPKNLKSLSERVFQPFYTEKAIVN